VNDHDITPPSGITEPIAILPDRDRIERLEHRLTALEGRFDRDHEPRIADLETIARANAHVPEAINRLLGHATSHGLVMQKVQQILENIHEHMSGKAPAPTPPDSPSAKTQISKRRRK